MKRYNLFEDSSTSIFFSPFQFEGVNSDAQVLIGVRVGLKFTLGVKEIRFNWTANYERFTGVVSLHELAYGGRCNQTRRFANSKKDDVSSIPVAKPDQKNQQIANAVVSNCCRVNKHCPSVWPLALLKQFGSCHWCADRA
ncbi:hypothetical protein T11_4925 [Trichinella zimbabwensis]|uniref:Uncharacterized protein n=1 Tax=Trichinella zimbabwensis TaxID=268475 RepID=A0A0V1I648_9BILA|nr:hypothetical protein T11_4925 [Trichinella zimbabwensis]